MNCFKTLFLISFTFINIMVDGQDNKEVYAEIVVLENDSLTNTIDSLNLKSHCIRKGENWYLDYRKEDYIILSRMRKAKLVQNLKDAEIYLTMKNDDIIFILSDKEENLPIRKTGFKVDLSEFTNVIDYSIEESTYWVLVEHNGKPKIVKEVLYNCN